MSTPSYNKAINFNGSVYAVAGGKIYRYRPPALGSKQQHEWVCVHDIGIDDPALGLTATLGSKRALVVTGAKRDIYSYDGSTWHDLGAFRKCICEIKKLMLMGCRCGGN